MNSGGSASPPPSRSVSSGSLAKGAATPARDQRLLSSFEGLLQEEVDYVRHLNFVLKSYCRPLHKGSNGAPKLSPSALQGMFQNLPEIRDLHKAFVSNLKQQLPLFQDPASLVFTDALGQLIASFTRAMVSVYAAYVKRLATAVDQVRFYERNKETFGSFLANVPVTEDAILYCGNDFRDRHCATDSSARLLRKFLVHPIHHPMRLFSRLTRLMRSVPPETPDFHSILVAAGVAWELDFYVTTKFRQGYDQLALYELSVMLADNHQFLSPDPNRTFIRRGVAMIARVKSTSRLWDSIRSFGRRKRAVSIDSFSSPASARSAADLSGSLEAPSHLSALDPSSLDARPIKVPPYAKFKLLSLYLLSDLVALLDAETNSGSAILKGYIPFQDAVYCPLSHDFGAPIGVQTVLYIQPPTGPVYFVTNDPSRPKSFLRELFRQIHFENNRVFNVPLAKIMPNSSGFVLPSIAAQASTSFRFDPTNFTTDSSSFSASSEHDLSEAPSLSESNPASSSSTSTPSSSSSSSSKHSKHKKTKSKRKRSSKHQLDEAQAHTSSTSTSTSTGAPTTVFASSATSATTTATNNLNLPVLVSEITSHLVSCARTSLVEGLFTGVVDHASIDSLRHRFDKRALDIQDINTRSPLALMMLLCNYLHLLPEPLLVFEERFATRSPFETLLKCNRASTSSPCRLQLLEYIVYFLMDLVMVSSLPEATSKSLLVAYFATSIIRPVVMKDEAYFVHLPHILKAMTALLENTSEFFNAARGARRTSLMPPVSSSESAETELLAFMTEPDGHDDRWRSVLLDDANLMVQFRRPDMFEQLVATVLRPFQHEHAFECSRRAALILCRPSMIDHIATHPELIDRLFVACFGGTPDAVVNRVVSRIPTEVDLRWWVEIMTAVLKGRTNDLLNFFLHYDTGRQWCGVLVDNAGSSNIQRFLHCLIEQQAIFQSAELAFIIDLAASNALRHLIDCAKLHSVSATTTSTSASSSSSSPLPLPPPSSSSSTSSSLRLAVDELPAASPATLSPKPNPNMARTHYECNTLDNLVQFVTHLLDTLSEWWTIDQDSQFCLLLLNPTTISLFCRAPFSCTMPQPYPQLFAVLLCSMLQHSVRVNCATLRGRTDMLYSPLLVHLLSDEISALICNVLLPDDHNPLETGFSTAIPRLGLFRMELCRLAATACMAVLDLWKEGFTLEAVFPNEHQALLAGLHSLTAACFCLCFRYPNHSILHAAMLAFFRAILECHQSLLRLPHSPSHSSPHSSLSSSPSPSPTPNSDLISAPHRTIASLAPPALLHHQYATTSTSTLSTSSLLLHQCADLLVHVLNSVQLIEKLVAGVSDPSEAHNAFCTLLVYEIDNRPATSKVIEEKMPPVLAEQWARACDEAISRVDLSKAEDDGDLLSIPNTTKRTPWWFSLRG